ncbi:hypothetical protein Q8A67_024541 [Cirrhinus molitorella]|uniref:Uncharacterized protein n=1 Tax=Cirrhinus molitorella TaxID=172907 RepID=A0AA88P5R9_9TELE|nr:hypothetical protein Q8A67_024541 [Cirrhinus molitorella]
MPSTTTKHIYLTVRGSGQHQSGDGFLAVSRAAFRDALLQPGSRSRPLALVFLSASPGRTRPFSAIERGAQLLPVPTHTQRTSMMAQQQQGREPVDEGNGKSGEDQSADMLSCLIYILECDWLSWL